MSYVVQLVIVLIMKYILTITLALFISSNVIADEKQYIDEGKSLADSVTVSKYYWKDGKYIYNLLESNNQGIFLGIEQRASSLCGNSGYTVLKEETSKNIHRKTAIRCNE